jgi:nitronate monooxygenase
VWDAEIIMTLRERLGLELPIVQAPMAGVQDHALAAAVSGAGGLGSLPAGMLAHDALRRELTALSARTNRPYNVNFFCHTLPVADARRDEAWRSTLAPYYHELGVTAADSPGMSSRLPFDQATATILAPFRPAVVSFHFGLPAAPLLQQVKAMGSVVMSTATTADEARWLEAHGADVIIAQGYEAGGHRGSFLSDDLTMQLGTFALLPQIVQAVSLPVVAAGGIADAAGVKAALLLGASAVQLGTSYLLCHEATTSPVHRAALAADDARHTAITNLFSGRPARGIVNRLMRELGPMRNDVPAFPTATSPLAPLRAAAEAAGKGDFSPLWAGQNVSGCRTVAAGDRTRELAG